MVFKKGQGATEYLVLLAVVLIIALVSIALLGFLPGLATDARIAQSSSYWRGEARPFAILEHSVASTGTGIIVLQTNDASGTLTITNMSVGAGTFNVITSVTFAPGEIKNISIANVTAAGGVTGGVYDVPVTITYTTASGVTNKEYGSKNIIGKLS